MTPAEAELVADPANAAVVRAPPKSIVTSLGIGMHADSSSISTKIASVAVVGEQACVIGSVNDGEQGGTFPVAGE